LSAMWLFDNNSYRIHDVNGNTTHPNKSINSNYLLEANKWTTITSTTNGTEQSIKFTDEGGEELTDIMTIAVTDDRTNWENVAVYLSDDFYTAAPVDVKNF
jgi:hypothetical protein